MKWLITGASRGIGAALVQAALEAGHEVVAAIRSGLYELEPLTLNESYKSKLFVVKMDVTKPEEVTKAVEAAIAKFGGIDILVNNAGFGVFGVFEELSTEEIEQQLLVNLYGTLHPTRAVLPLQMRKQKSGHIITMSSLAGFLGIRLGSAYTISKFALEGFMESLRLEVAPFGIKATTVEPGYFLTNFVNEMAAGKSSGSITEYDQLRAEADVAWEQMTSKNPNPGDKNKLARAIVQLANQSEPPSHFIAGAEAVQAYEQAVLAPRLAELKQWKSLSTNLGIDKAAEVEPAGH